MTNETMNSSSLRLFAFNIGAIDADEYRSQGRKQLMAYRRTSLEFLPASQGRLIPIIILPKVLKKR